MKSVVITIDEEGNIQIESSGFKGVSCLKELESLEKSLGKVSHLEKKPEYFSQDVSQKLQVKQ